MMTDPTVVVPFVPRRRRKGAPDRIPGADRATAIQRTSGHLTRIAALLGMPVESFFREVPDRGLTQPEPREVLELLDIFRRIGSADARSRVLEAAKSALGNKVGSRDLSDA